MQYLIRPFLSPRERLVQDEVSSIVRSIDREVEARELQGAFLKESRRSLILGLVVYYLNDQRDSGLMSMTTTELEEYKTYCQNVGRSRSEIRKVVVAQMRL